MQPFLVICGILGLTAVTIAGMTAIVFYWHMRRDYFKQKIKEQHNKEIGARMIFDADRFGSCPEALMALKAYGMCIEESSMYRMNKRWEDRHRDNPNIQPEKIYDLLIRFLKSVESSEEKEIDWVEELQRDLCDSSKAELQKLATIVSAVESEIADNTIARVH